MQTIGIFYFSGTGNTEIVAKKLRKAFEHRQKKVEIFRIEDILNNKQQVDFSVFDLIGIGHPVLGFGASGIVECFIEGLPIRMENMAFVFKTASSPHYINHGASNTIIKTMENRGYQVFHNSILAMPCNWFMKYDDRMNKQLYEAVVKKVERIADEIVNRKIRLLKINDHLARFLRMIYYLEENCGAKFFAKGLKTTNNCILCKKCVRDCPMKNIQEEQGKICFGSDCIWCMRCIYSCPENAIRATNLSASVLKSFNGGFNIDKVLNNPTIEGNFVTDQTKGYYKHFINYFKDV